MYPRIVKITLLLPWQPPQVVICREILRGIYRLCVQDRFDRKINYAGSDIGFGVKLFKSTQDHTYIVVKGNWDEATYCASNQISQSITILDIETDDL
jgi:hypothetical protein